MPTTCPITNACLRVIVSGDFGAGIEARAGDVCSLAYIGGNWGTRRSYKWAYGRKFGLGWAYTESTPCDWYVYIYIYEGSASVRSRHVHMFSNAPMIVYPGVA